MSEADWAESFPHLHRGKGALGGEASGDDQRLLDCLLWEVVIKNYHNRDHDHHHHQHLLKLPLQSVSIDHEESEEKKVGKHDVHVCNCCVIGWVKTALIMMNEFWTDE